MKCLVTGGAGFIGSHIVFALLKKGHKVRVLDNLSSGYESNLESAKGDIEFIKGDLRNPKDIQRSVKGIDWIFHEAALRSVQRSVDDPVQSNSVNVTCSMHLLLAAQKAGVQRLMYASSSSIYGENKVYPQKESFKAMPISPYAVSKYSGEMYCSVFSRLYGIETVALRYFNVFGPRQSPESQYAAVIPLFMRSAAAGKDLEMHSDGKQSRDFTYVDNIVAANLLAASARGASGQVFNIACGTTTSLLQIVHELEKLFRRKLTVKHYPARAGDVRKTWADITLAKRVLHYQPKVGFTEGMRRTWDWYMQTKP